MPIRQSDMLDLIKAGKAFLELCNQMVCKIEADRELFFNGIKEGSGRDYNLELYMTMRDDYRSILLEYGLVIKKHDTYYTNAKVHKNNKNREHQTYKRRFDGVQPQHVAARDFTKPYVPNSADLNIQLSIEKEEEAKRVMEEYLKNQGGQNNGNVKPT